jgi:azurin
MRIDSDGNVGIGTASPSRLLSIGDGTGSPNIQLLAAVSGNSRIEFGDSDDSDAGEIQYVHSSNYMQFTTNGSERMRIDSNGQVHFKSSTDYKIGLNDSAGASQWWLKSYTNGGFALHENNVGDKFNIAAGGNATFANDVNVGTFTDTGTSALNIRTAAEHDSKLGLFESNGSHGFSLNYDGGLNQFLLKRHDNSSSGTTVLSLNRSNNNATFTGDLTVGGNLIVNGTTTTLNTQTVEVEDNILQLNTTQGTPDTATAATSGISVYRGNGVTQASLIFDEADDTWDLTNNLSVAGDLTVLGGDIVLSGTGRIQGIDTVTASTDAVNKSYVDSVVATPVAPTNLSLTIVGETVNVTFDKSTTADIDLYSVFASSNGSDYSLISVLPPDDHANTMSIIDDSFDDSGTQAYRVYAQKNGVISANLNGNISYSVTSPLEPTNLSVVSLNSAYYVQWDPPSSNFRFITAYNVYKHEHASSGSLARLSASLVYSGMNTSYMYQISGADNTNYHQFWVETTTT